MNPLFAAVVGSTLALGAPHGMQPRVLMGDVSHCDAVMVQNGHIVVEEVCIKGSGNPKPPFHAEVGWDGQVATITASDEKASAEWIRAHSLLPRLSMKHHDLYWDGKKVDLGKVDVFGLYLAFPWHRWCVDLRADYPPEGFFRVLAIQRSLYRRPGSRAVLCNFLRSQYSEGGRLLAKWICGSRFFLIPYPRLTLTDSI